MPKALCTLLLVLLHAAVACAAPFTFESDPPGATVTAILGPRRVELGVCGRPIERIPRELAAHVAVRLEFKLGEDYVETREVGWDGPAGTPRAGQDLYVELKPVTLRAWIATLWRRHGTSVAGGLGVAIAALYVGLRVLGRQQRRAQEALIHQSLQVESDPADPLVGSTLGGWRLVERIGSGATATVYRAVAARDGIEERAIKVLPPEFADDPDFRKRFSRELEFAQRFEHPSLLRIDEWGEYEGRIFLVMELVRGQSLREVIKSSGLDAGEVLRIARPLFTAVEEAHRRGVVHRDLKPENIMCTSAGVKVMDFGLARTESFSRMTETGTVLGTPAYISPEQIMGRSVDSRADQYALGAILFEMVSGHPPFAADDPFVLLNMHLTEDVPALARAAEAEPIIRRMLSRNPSDRYSTLTDALKALEDAQQPARGR